MVRHVAAALLLVLVGLLAPAGGAQAMPHHQPAATTVAAGDSTMASEANCPSHPAPQADYDCCTMGCSASALPVKVPARARLSRGLTDLPAPMLAILGRHPEGLFRPPR